MSAWQVVKNVSYTGRFFVALAPLIARALPLAARVMPTIMSELATGLLSGSVHKVISGSGVAVWLMYLVVQVKKGVWVR